MTGYRSGSKVWPVGTNNQAPFALDGAKGVNIWTDISAANGGTITVKMQQQTPGGAWLDLPGVVTAGLAAVAATRLQVYPGLTAAANTIVNACLGGGVYRVVGTVTGGAPTAQVVVDRIV